MEASLVGAIVLMLMLMLFVRSSVRSLNPGGDRGERPPHSASSAACVRPDEAPLLIEWLNREYERLCELYATADRVVAAVRRFFGAFDGEATAVRKLKGAVFRIGHFARPHSSGESSQHDLRGLTFYAALVHVVLERRPALRRDLEKAGILTSRGEMGHLEYLAHKYLSPEDRPQFRQRVEQIAVLAIEELKNA